MMKFNTLMLISLFLIGQLDAQAVFEEDMNMSLGTKNALYVDVEGADKKIAEKAIENLLKEYGKVKKNRKAKEYYAEGITIPAIGGAQPLDIFVKIDEMKSQSRLYMWVYDGSTFINSIDDADQVDGAESILKDFFVKARRLAIQKEVDHEEDNLKDREKELKKLEDKNKNLHKDIAKWEKEIEDRKRKIEQAKVDIEQNLVDQDEKAVEITEQKDVVRSTVEKMNNVQRH